MTYSDRQLEARGIWQVRIISYDDLHACIGTFAYKLGLDARFEVLGSPYSMLSVTLSPSQRLYTRRGTLVAVAGKPDDVC